MLHHLSRGVAKRLEIAVLPTEVEALRPVTALTGQTTLAAVLRDALKAYAWMVMEQRRNRRIISKDRALITRIPARWRHGEPIEEPLK